MIPRLGLVCISERLTHQKISAQVMTRKRFNSLPREVALQNLSERILHNTKHLLRTLQACVDVSARHYRVSSSMFPLLTDPTLEICYDDLTHMPEIRRHLMTSGEYAREHDITCSMHPDQFNVLTSYSPTVVDKTIVELNHQSDVLDMMGYSPDYGSPMCLHLNKSPDLKKESVSEYVGRFLDGLSRCNAGVQQRLVLENEDKAAWNCVTLYENFSSHVPLVFDNLHHVCNPSGDEFENAKLFKETWRGHTPVFHWSESMPDSTNKRSHANYATHLPPVVFDNLDATWEVELKSKDNAIHHILTSFFAN